MMSFSSKPSLVFQRSEMNTEDISVKQTMVFSLIYVPHLYNQLMYTCKSPAVMLDIHLTGVTHYCQTVPSSPEKASTIKIIGPKQTKKFKMHMGACWTPFWQFHHALLHDGSSHNWHLSALIKAQNKVGTLWTKRFRWFQWQRSWFWDTASKEIIQHTHACRP